MLGGTSGPRNCIDSKRTSNRLKEHHDILESLSQLRRLVSPLTRVLTQEGCPKTKLVKALVCDLFKAGKGSSWPRPKMIRQLKLARPLELVMPIRSNIIALLL